MAHASRLRLYAALSALGSSLMLPSCSQGGQAGEPLCGIGVVAQGCACSTPGETVPCGDLSVSTFETEFCAEAHHLCGDDGLWSSCRIIPEHSTLSHLGRPAGLPPRGAALGPAEDCDTNTCDAFCKQFPDVPDASLAGNGLVYDGGITLEAEPPVVNPNGPPSAETITTLTDAGLLPADPNYIYHEVLPGGASAGPDPFTLDAQLDFIDVYFALDNSATMRNAIVEVGNKVAGAGGIISQVTSTFPNARFGVGHHMAYEQFPYVRANRAASAHTEALGHTLNLTQNAADASAAMLWLANDGTRSNRTKTEGFAVGLFAISYIDPQRPELGPYLYRGAGTDPADVTDPANFWVAPRNATGAASWVSDYGGMAPPAVETGPCPDPAIPGRAGQGLGYPCVAPGSFPIVIMVTDNAPDQGPGGFYSYGHPSMEPTQTVYPGIQGSSPWPNAVDVDAQNNGVAGNAVTIDPSVFGRYKGTIGSSGPAAGTRSASQDGDTTRGFSSLPENFPTDAQLDCGNNDGRFAPEAYFEFTLTETEFVHFNTWGSGFDTILYVIDRSTNERVACGDSISWMRNAIINGFDPNTTFTNGIWETTDLQARLQPGDYYLVLDSKSSAPPPPPNCPSGYDHVVVGGDDRCYRRINSRRRWVQARDDCADDATGASLVTINDPATDAALLAQYPQIANNAYWIGYSRSGGSFGWESGEANGTTSWAATQPRATPRDCTQRSGNGTWTSENCNASNRRRRYLCEAPFVTPPTPTPVLVGDDPEYFLQVNAMDDGYPIAAPSWNQTVNAMNAGGYKMIAIETSGMGPIRIDGNGDPFHDTCTSAGASNHVTDRWTYLQLQEMARATGSIDTSNPDPWTNPYVFSLNKNAEACHSGDPHVGTVVVDAIRSLTANVRDDVVLRTVDADDDSDFDYDGPPGAIPQLTARNIDEGPSPARPYGLFIETVTVVPVMNGTNGSHDTVPGGAMRCLDDPNTPDILEQCLPDTEVRFDVTFSAPAELDVLSWDQIFTFEVSASSGNTVLAAEDVVIKIPKSGASEATFTRTFDLTNVCERGHRPIWGLFTWRADTPGNSEIELFVRTADTSTALDSAPRVPASDGFALIANSAANGGDIQGSLGFTGDTQSGAVFVDEILDIEGARRNHPFLRLEADLKPGLDGRSIPTLQDWKMEVSCPPDD